MYRILSNEEERQIVSQLELEFIERILNHEQLLIESEDQLLEFINSLYEKNRESSFLYEYVNFVNCSSRSMQIFLNTFSIENINEGIWNQMKGRLEQPIVQQNQINQIDIILQNFLKAVQILMELSIIFENKQIIKLKTKSKLLHLQFMTMT